MLFHLRYKKMYFYGLNKAKIIRVVLQENTILVYLLQHFTFQCVARNFLLNLLLVNPAAIFKPFLSYMSNLFTCLSDTFSFIQLIVIN